MSLDLENGLYDNENTCEKSFYEYSKVVGGRIDITTGKITKILNSDRGLNTRGRLVPNSNGIDNSTGREIGEWGEIKASFLLNGVEKSYMNNVYDLELANKIFEVKTCKRGNGSVIREKQLIDFLNIEGKNKYYVLVYYDIKGEHKISNVSPENLSSILIPFGVYIFPIDYIVYYYNLSVTKKILAKAGYFKKIHMRSANELFNLETGGLFRREVFKLWGIDIKLIDFVGSKLDINKMVTNKIIL